MSDMVYDEVYLGDGLYASFDGSMIKLRAPRYEGDHWVGLEPGVLQAFDEYRRDLVRALHQMQRQTGAANKERETTMTPEEKHENEIADAAPAAEAAPAETVEAAPPAEQAPAEAPPAEEPKAAE